MDVVQLGQSEIPFLRRWHLRRHPNKGRNESCRSRAKTFQAEGVAQLRGCKEGQRGGAEWGEGQGSSRGRQAEGLAEFSGGSSVCAWKIVACILNDIIMAILSTFHSLGKFCLLPTSCKAVRQFSKTVCLKSPWSVAPGQLPEDRGSNPNQNLQGVRPRPLFYFVSGTFQVILICSWGACLGRCL